MEGTRQLGILLFYLHDPGRLIEFHKSIKNYDQMKNLYRKVPVKLEKSFNIRRDIKPCFTGIGHYHSQLELHYIIKGEGIRFVGDTRTSFSAGEMVLVGENLPHAWRSTEDFLSSTSDNIDVVVVNFVPEFLGLHFLQLPETTGIKKLLERAKNGIEFYGPVREEVGELLLKLFDVHGFERIMSFLKILHLLANSNDCNAIVTSKDMLFQRDESEALRLGLICDYTLANYTREISLEEISSICSLNVTSFCRYFKTMTDKTYLNFLNEIRISEACRLLLEDPFPAETICFNCGFQNVSNFYRHFKKVTGMTPQEYRKKFLLGKDGSRQRRQYA